MVGFREPEAPLPVGWTPGQLREERLLEAMVVPVELPPPPPMPGPLVLAARAVAAMPGLRMRGSGMTSFPMLRRTS